MEFCWVMMQVNNAIEGISCERTNVKFLSPAHILISLIYLNERGRHIREFFICYYHPLIFEEKHRQILNILVGEKALFEILISPQSPPNDSNAKANIKIAFTIWWGNSSSNGKQKKTFWPSEILQISRQKLLLKYLNYWVRGSVSDVTS